MKKSKFNLGFIIVGILAAMLIAIMPSAAMAGAGGFEGLGELCDDDVITYEKAGGPVYLGTVTVSYDLGLSNVNINGSVSQGNKCTATFGNALYLTGVNQSEWYFIKDDKGHNMKGLRLGIDASVTQTPDGCVIMENSPQCFEIIAVGNFNLINDEMFSGMFVLMPLE